MTGMRRGNEAVRLRELEQRVNRLEQLLGRTAGRIDTAVIYETDTYVVVDTNGKGLVQRSPDGTYWLLSVSNAGVDTWTALPAKP